MWLCQTKALRNGLGFRAQARNLTIPVEVAKRAGILARVLKPVEGAVQRRGMSVLGVQPFTLAGATVFVLPNPSGRNANYSYAEMLTAFRALKSLVDAA